MAELLAKTPEHLRDPNSIKDQPLFPGRSCFPLSPDRQAKKKANQKFPISEQDQLNVIMEVLGAPSEEDLSFITDQTAIQYLKEFPPHTVGIDFKQRFPYASDLCIDLIKRMVQFNPFLRSSVQDCLAHPFFGNIRKQSNEQVSPFLIELEIDKS